MTENKRFYYNTFYHADDMSRVLEYEIIDRQSYPNYPHYDEKEDIPNWYIYIGENDSGWQDMLVDLLNEQDATIKKLEKENEQLKKDATILIQSNQDYRKENQALMKQIEKGIESFKKLQREQIKNE